MVRTAKQGAIELQKAASERLQESRKAAREAESATDDAKRLALLMTARSKAEGAKALSEAASRLARTSGSKR
jgi:hypothetical protein